MSLDLSNVQKRVEAAQAARFAPKKPGRKPWQPRALWEQEAVATWKLLDPGDEEARKYLPRYLQWFKAASTSHLLGELKENRAIALTKKNPARWFTTVANKLTHPKKP